MSIMRCETHDMSWDSDFLEDCPKCVAEKAAALSEPLMEIFERVWRGPQPTRHELCPDENGRCQYGSDDSCEAVAAQYGPFISGGDSR